MLDGVLRALENSGTGDPLSVALTGIGGIG